MVVETFAIKTFLARVTEIASIMNPPSHTGFFLLDLRKFYVRDELMRIRQNRPVDNFIYAFNLLNALCHGISSNLAVARFDFKAPFGAAIIRGQLDFEGGAYSD